MIDNKKLTVAERVELEREQNIINRQNRINEYFRELEYRKNHTVLHDADYYENQVNQSNFTFCSDII
jgi:aminoglycoside N3'-acetyltransferase